MTHTPHAAGGLHQIIDTESIREDIRVGVEDASLKARLLTLANGYDALIAEVAQHTELVHHQHTYLELLRHHLAGVQQIINRWVAEEEA